MPAFATATPAAADDTAPAPTQGPLDTLDAIVAGGDVQLDDLSLWQAIVAGYRAQNTTQERIIFALGVLFIVVFGVMSGLIAFLGYQNAKSIPAGGLLGGGVKFLLTLAATLASGTPSGTDDRVVTWMAGLLRYDVVKRPDGALELVPKNNPLTPTPSPSRGEGNPTGAAG